MYNFEGKRVLLTGASKGLGAVTAKAFADNGAKMVITSRSADLLDKLKNSLHNPDKHLTFVADLTQPNKSKELVKESERHLGDIDVVIHCAGGGLGLKNPLLSLQDFRKLYELNVGIALGINQLVIPKMIEKRAGNVVHVCSIASSEATGSVGYNVSKSALSAYVRSLGREIAGTGVIVTGILPGAFLGPLNSFVRLRDRNPEAYKNFIQERLPRKRIGKADEILPLLLFLSSESASMMSGCCVPIDAGEGLSFLAQ